MEKEKIYQRVHEIVRDTIPDDAHLLYYPGKSMFTGYRDDRAEPPIEIFWNDELTSVISNEVDLQLKIIGKVYLYVCRDNEEVVFEYLLEEERKLAEENGGIELEGQLIIGWD